MCPVMQTAINAQSFDDSAQPSARRTWQEVVSGRFRIRHWYDREGRRYVVLAKRAGAENPRELTPREQKALVLRAAGAALKVIALELGVSLSTAARDLERSMAVLGLATDADLAAVLGRGRA